MPYGLFTLYVQLDFTIGLFAKRLEKSIFNWYYGGENANPELVFNALHDGFANDMQILVPIETPEAMLRMIGDPTHLKAGDAFTSEEPVAIRFRHLIANEEGEYYIPVFTSNEEIKNGEGSCFINQSLKDLIDILPNWYKCLGLVMNPWDQQLLLSKEMLEAVIDYTPKSHIALIKGSVVDMHVDAIVNAAKKKPSRRQRC